MSPAGMKINNIPSLTWNSLKVNGAFADYPEPAQGAKGAVYSEANAAQLRHERKPQDEALKWAESFTGEIKREEITAGKRAIYQEQAFATALGGEFTDFIAGNAPETDIYTIEEGKSPALPVIVRLDFSGEIQECRQQIIHAKKNSKATVILVSASAPNARGTFACVLRAIVEENAHLTLIKVNLPGDGMTVYDDTGAFLGTGGRLDFNQIILGGSRVYAGCLADMRGDGSVFNVRCAYLAVREGLFDINYVAVQRGRGTVSDIRSDGALGGHAKKTLKGTIDFRKGAKDSKGEEREDVLVLSPSVVNKSVPIVLSEEEDVEGHHGATIGNLSEDVLYYLGTRGIDRKNAELLMTQGKLLSVANLIPDVETIKRITCFIREAFDLHE